jgi:hypothetical protein
MTDYLFECANDKRSARVDRLLRRLKEPNFGYRLLRVIYPAFRVLLPDQVIRTDDLARAMVDAALRRTGDPGGLVFENRDIRAMAQRFVRS